MITITYDSIPDLSLTDLYVEIPNTLPAGSLCIYRIPDGVGGWTYKVFYNASPMEQRPNCACELFTLLGKYTIDEDQQTYTVIHEHDLVVSTIAVV